MNFKSKILILPGLQNSGPQHWQSLWEKEHPEFTRVQQQDWDTPKRTQWVETLDAQITAFGADNIILVGHSLACPTVAFWAAQSRRKIKGALLVAPVDTETPNFPAEAQGFSPLPLIPLPFHSIVVASANDPWATLSRAAFFAGQWGSEFINLGNAGHISASSGFGEWKAGLELLKKLDGE